MTRNPIIAAAVLLAACGGDPAPAPQALDEPKAVRHAVIQRIAGADGGYDYLSVDSAAKRLFAAREFGVTAIDLASGAVTERLVAANDVSAVLILPGGNRMLSTVYGDGKAVIFDRTTGKLAGEVKTGASPDAAAFDPASGLVFVMNAKSNDATVIDPDAMAAVATIAMGGKPEAGAADGKGRLYVNIEDRAEIAVIDTARRAVVARHKLAGCVEPTGIAYDPATATLIAACHNGTAKLTDAASGADRGSVTIGKEADGAIFNPATRLAYLPAKDGTLTIFRLDDQAKPKDIEIVKTAPGARTAALDPATGRIYLSAAQFRPDGKGDEEQVPGSFAFIVVAP